MDMIPEIIMIIVFFGFVALLFATVKNDGKDSVNDSTKKNMSDLIEFIYQRSNRGQKHTMTGYSYNDNSLVGGTTYHYKTESVPLEFHTAADEAEFDEKFKNTVLCLAKEKFPEFAEKIARKKETVK